MPEVVKELSALKYLDPKGAFQSLAEAVSDTIIIIDPIDFKIKYVNHIFRGRKVEDFVGENIFNFIFPEHHELYRNIFIEILKSPAKEKRKFETSYISQEYGNIWYNVTVSTLLGENGEVVNLLLNWNDITQAKLHGIEMHNKEENLYAIINNTEDLIVAIDGEHQITEYNSVFGALVELGYGIKEIKGTPILNYIDPKKRDHFKKIYEKVFKGEIVNDIAQFDTRAATFLYMESSYNPIYNFERVVTGISIFSRNITQRVLNDQKLQNALKEKEILLSEIHHRIKNNLALVSSMLQLKEMNLDNVAAKEALRDSRKRIKSTALVHEMLYKNDSFDNLKLNEYIPELFKNVNVNSSIILDFEGDDYTLGLNEALPFGLMLHELMMNSFKHSFKGRERAKLEIRSKLKDSFLNIEYCDCCGVFPNDVNFSDTSTTGLMLIHTFIEQLNGTIRLISKEPPTYAIQIPVQ